MKKTIIGVIVLLTILMVGCSVPPDMSERTQGYARLEEVERGALPYKNVEDKQVIEDNAVLDLHMIGFGWASDNKEKIVFNYYITNYGNAIENNLSVICIVQDNESNILFKGKDNVGYVEALNKNIYQSKFNYVSKEIEGNLFGDCVISNCNNCIQLGSILKGK